MVDGKILGFVGARGGSKGLPGKSNMDFAGQPMFLWTLDALRESPYVHTAFLSTDDPNILEESKKRGYGTSYRRPDELSGDHSEIGDAILHALEWLNVHQGESFDYILLAQPTSPLRGVEHINAAIEQYFRERKSHDETLVSVYEAPPKTGWLTHQTDEGYLEFTFSNESSQPRQRQKLDQWFFPNGAIYLAPLKDFKGEFYSKKTQMYVMPEEYSVDIDTLEDFEKALEVKRTLSSSHEGSQ